MLKKSTWLILIIGSLLIISAAIYGYRYITTPKSNPIEAIPPQSAIVVKGVNPRAFWDAITYENNIANHVAQNAAWNRVIQQINQLDSIARTQNEIDEIVSNRECYFALLLDNQQQIAPLFLFELPNAHCKKEVIQFIEKGLPTTYSLEKEKQNQYQFYHIASPIDTLLSLSFKQGICIVSNNMDAIETSLATLISPTKITASPSFQKIYTIAGQNVDANIFIQSEQLSQLLTTIFNNENHTTAEKIKKYATSCGLDLYAKYDRAFLSGFTISGDANLTVFNGQEDTKERVAKFLPINTGALLRIGFSDLEMILTAQVEQLERNGHSIHLSSRDKKIINQCNALFKDEMASAFFEDNNIVLLKCNNKRALLPLLNAKETPYHYHEIKIRTTDLFQLTTKLQLPLFPTTTKGYWCFYQDYIVLSSSATHLKNYLSAVCSGRTLDQNNHYASLQENYESSSLFSFYFNSKDAKTLLSSVLTKSSYDLLNKHHSIFDNFDGIAGQMSSDDGDFYTNIVLQCTTPAKKITTPDAVVSEEENITQEEQAKSVDSTELEESISVVDTVTTSTSNTATSVINEQTNLNATSSSWEFLLEGDIVGKPYFVKDHRANKQKIIVFDSKAHMYLINHKGEVQWKISLPELPISQVYQVDLYKNGKIQYMFNTPNYLLCIDLLGREVQGFPAKLPSKAVNPIAVFDFKKNKNYTILYVGKDNKVYCLDKKGHTVANWKYPTVTHPVTSQIQYLAKGKNQYIIVPMDNGSALLVSTTGNLRMKIEKSFSNALGSDFYLNRTNSKGVILTTDKNGTLIYIPTKGAVKRTIFDQYSANHFFIYDDFNSDKSRDFIFLDGKKLRIYDRLQNILLSYTFPIKIELKPQLIVDSNGETLLVVVSPKEDKIYKFNKAGLIKEERLEGKTAIDAKSIKPNSPMVIIRGSGKKLLFNSLD